MSKYRIRPLTLSRALAEKGIMTYLAHYGEKIWRPYTFWVIEGAEQNILVDTAIQENFYPGEDIREKGSPTAGYPVMIPGIHFDAFKAYASVCKIKKMADLVLPIHDPEIMDLEVIPKP